MKRKKGFQPLLIVFLLALSFFLSRQIGTHTGEAAGLFILFIAAVLWVTEVIPLPVTALLIPVLAVFFNVFETHQALTYFAHPIIFVFIGGFTLATVLGEHGIDKWLAKKVITVSKGKRWVALMGLFATVSLLSMWMSNTATTAMMLPISMSLISKAYPRARAFTIIGTAYAANIGGIATVIGSPPNLIASAILGIDFMGWMRFGLPIALVLFPLLMTLLRIVLKPEDDFKLNVDGDYSASWDRKKSLVGAFFLIVIACWMFSSLLSKLFGISNFDSIVAIMATFSAPILGLSSWKTLEKRTNWGILLLFGGGLCLSAILIETGTSQMIANELLQWYSGGNNFLLILFPVVFMIFLTEISSNTGAAAILVPIILAVAMELGGHLTVPMVLGVGFAANCAFMLPVATPPNALAYATGEVSIRQMVKAGIFLNLAAGPVIALLVYLLS